MSHFFAFVAGCAFALFAMSVRQGYVNVAVCSGTAMTLAGLVARAAHREGR